MAQVVEWEIQGLESLRKRLSEIQQDMQERQIAFAARKAAQVIARKAADNAKKIDDPATAESISKNIWDGGKKYPGVRKKSKRSTGPGEIGFRIGVAGGARSYGNTRENRRKGRVGKTYEVGGDKNNPGGDTFYWRFHEFGTEKMEATPFLRPAAKQAAPQAIATFTEELGNAIERATKAAVRKHRSRSRTQRFRRRISGVD